MSFTTVDNVTMFLNKETLTSFEEDVVRMLIPYVDGVMNNYCGTNLLATDYTDVRFDGSGSDTLDLKVYPINSVTHVKLREDATTFTDVVTSVYLNNDSYLYLDPYADTTTFPSGRKNVYVTFNAGYTEDAVPAELGYAACHLISINFRKITDETIGIEEGKFGEADFKLSSLELPVLVKRVLDRYRMVSIY